MLMDGQPSINITYILLMKTLKYLLFIVLFISYNQVFSQIWPKVYLANQGTTPLSVFKNYDNGYLFGGWFLTTDGFPINGLLLKTTINGDMLWYKRLGENNDGTGICDINQTNDNGLIISGSTQQTDSWGDPFIMKLNACMEKEWCRIFAVGQNRADYTQSIKQIPGGYIAMVFYGNEFFSNEKLYLYRLDNNGDLLWQQQYGNTDSMMAGAEGYDMTVTPDLKYLIGGFCYYPDSGTSGPRYLRPLIIQVDSIGSTTWELPWRYISGAHFYGMAYRSIIDNKNTIYTCGRHIEEEATPSGDRPTMLKTDDNGNELAYYDLVNDSKQAVFFTINWFADSTIALGGGWSYSMTDHHQAVFKVDRNGSVIDSVELLQSLYSFSDAVTDTDNKLFLVSGQHDGNQWRTYAWKLNSDLEYDTLYTHPFVYDSLCPHPIPSDTIPLDCVVVGLNEPFENPETGRLKVYPNPASDVLHVEIPDKLKSETHSPVFNLTTVYHQWKSAVMEVYNLFGKQVFSKEIRQTEKLLDLNIAEWPRGMYVVRLVYNGKTVASEKVVVG